MNRTVLLLMGVLFVMALRLPAQTVTAAPERLIADAIQAEDIEVSSFGSYIAIYDASEGNTLRMFGPDLSELWRRRLPFFWAGSLDAASVIEFSNDETRVFFPGGRQENDVCICDSRTGEIISILRGHENDVNVIALSPDESRLLTASYNEIALWERAGTGYELVTMDEFEPSLKAAEFLPDNRRLVISQTSGQTRSILLLDSASGTLETLDEYSLQDNNISLDIYEISVSSDGELIAGGYRDRIFILEIGDQSLTLQHTISEISSGNTYAVRFSPQSDRLVSAHFRFLNVWNRAEGWEEAAVIGTQQPAISDLEISEDGTTIFIATTADENAVALLAAEGLPSSPLGRIADAFPNGAPLSVIRTLTRDGAQSIIENVPDTLFAPRDMFETTDEYDRRVASRRSTLLAGVYDAVEAHFNAERISNPAATHDLLVTLDAQGSYDVDRSIYTLRVLGTEATVQIARDAARSLFQNWETSRVRITRFENQGSPDFADFRLIHPTNATSYPIQFRVNPFTGEPTNMAGRRVAAVSVGPHITLRNLRLLGIFPALYQRYDSDLPFGEMSIVNTGTGIVSDLSVTVSIPDVTSAPRTLVLPSSISAGQEIDVALHAAMLPAVLESIEGGPATVEIDVSYRRGASRVQETVRQQIQVLNRNAIQWADDRRVGAFMTVADPEILAFAGASASTPAMAPTAAITRNMLYALHIVEAIRDAGVRYVIDPNSAYQELSEDVGAVDYLRFPRETLSALAGDCDDISVLAATLLESVGVPTAFITTPGHIFLAFDTGIGPSGLGRAFANESALIEQEGRIWMPLELTTGEGFVRAWQTGALQWRQAVDEGVAGWFTAEEAWRRYSPVAPPLSSTLDAVAESRVTSQVLVELDRFRELELAPRLSKVSEETRNKPGRVRSNRLGVLYATYGLLEEAATAFEEAAVGEYVPALVNLANVLSINGDHETARDVLERARTAEPENARVLLGLAFSYWESGNQENARDTYAAASRISPTLARRYPLFDAETNGTRATEAGRTSLFTEEWADDTDE